MKPEMYRDKFVLAPMVRTNSLPFRLLCLKYGADLVYTEELIDYRLCSCKRLENKILGTVDYIDEQGEIILRTCPALEKDKLILQIGSNNPDRAIKATKLAAQDIAGLDFNFGCPKAFSLSGGMGAALLERPGEIRALLSSAVKNLDLPVTCKIRILPDLNETLELVRMIEKCGVSALAVHGRTKDQRPRHDNRNDVLTKISHTLEHIPMIANGGSNTIRTYSNLLKFKEETNASSVMIARAAMKNPSIFKSDNQLEPIERIAEEFIKLSVKYDNYVSNTKYCLQTILSSGHFGSEFMQKFHTANDMKSICDLFPNLVNWYEQHKLSPQQRSDFYDSKQIENEPLESYILSRRHQLQSENIKFICDTVPYNAKIYGPKTPKAQLSDYMNRLPLHQRPLFEVFQLVTTSNKKGSYYCTVTHENVCYLNKTFANSKKNAEHSTALLVCEQLRLVDLKSYREQVASVCCGRNVT